MKNNIFFLISALFLIKSVAGQMVNLGTLKVNSNSLLYTADGTNFTNSVAASLTNDGNIRVGGDFFVQSDPTKFVNTYTNGTNYGQLIVKSTSAINPTGKITQQTVIEQASQAGFFSEIAFPFKGYTANEFLNSLGLTSTSYSTVTCSLSYWNPSVCFGLRKFYGQNAMYYFDNRLLTYEGVVEEMLPTFNISNGKKIVLNNSSNNFFAATTSNPAVRNISGTPENAQITPNANPQFAFNPYTSSEFGVAGSVGFSTGRNRRGQLWEDLFEDPVRMPGNPDRFRWTYVLANPYPSNIDLSYIGITGADPDGAGPLVSRDTDGMAIDILAISVIDDNVVPSLSGSAYVYSTLDAIFDTTLGATKGRLLTGDARALLIRPYQAFAIFGNGVNVNSFIFSDGLKTFSSTPKALDADGNGLSGDNDVDANPLTPSGFGSLKKFRESAYPNMSNISIGFQVFDNENDDKGSTAMYVYANENISDNFIFNNKYDNNNVNSNSIIYTLKTDYYGNKVDGVADFNYKYKAQSLKINEYRKIPVGFKAPINGDGNYIIKTGKDKQIIYGADESAFPELFTFVDEQLGVSMPITANFSYEFSQKTDTENRFYIVYKNKSIDTSGTNALVTVTKIYKEDSTNDNYLLLGSDVTIDNPNIQIYSSSGQLIDSFSSNGEYKIKLKNYAPGVYFVKVEGLKIALKLISYNY